MVTLESLTSGISLVGIEPPLVGTVVATVPIGEGAIQVIYKTPEGTLKIKRTKRLLFAEKMGQHTRHLLLMTATPHNGKEEDFQLFLSLLDSDRFYGKFRDGDELAPERPANQSAG